MQETSSLSEEQLGIRRDLRGILPHGENDSRRTPASPVIVDCLQPLLQISHSIHQRWFQLTVLPHCICSPKLEVALQWDLSFKSQSLLCPVLQHWDAMHLTIYETRTATALCPIPDPRTQCCPIISGTGSPAEPHPVASKSYFDWHYQGHPVFALRPAPRTQIVALTLISRTGLPLL